MLFVLEQIIYYDYGKVSSVVYTRIILGHICEYEYLIRIPDKNKYYEVYNTTNGNLD